MRAAPEGVMADDSENAAKPKGLCFVVMGFGKKTDYPTGRLLDLDKSYEYLIKPVAEAKGLECVRSADIRHSGVIDLVMYQKLLLADVVIADLSTTNPNALYELGIRHALRPRTTILISENKLVRPFDLSHIVINEYHHLGYGIHYREVKRFQQVLSETLDQVLRVHVPDSPVYTFLASLKPPYIEEAPAVSLPPALENSSEETTVAKTLAAFIKEGEQAIDDKQFSRAKVEFSSALKLFEQTPDPYLVQRLAFATFRAEKPDKVTSAKAALNILELKLDLKVSNDPETIGLASAIERQLFENGEEPRAPHLDEAIRYSARGYFLRSNRYNGISLALLLNIRTDSGETEQLKIADMVWANRIRHEIVDLCKEEIVELQEEKAQQEADTILAPEKLVKEWKRRHDLRNFWCRTAKAEAHFGLGEWDDYERARADAMQMPHRQWRWDTFEERIKKLGELLAKHGHLLNPPWPKSKERTNQ
jgi:hypothetical protein